MKIYSDFQTQSQHIFHITFRGFQQPLFEGFLSFLCDAFQWVLLACALCLAAFTAKVHLAFLHNIYREESWWTLSFLHLFVSCHLGYVLNKRSNQLYSIHLFFLPFQKDSTDNHIVHKPCSHGKENNVGCSMEEAFSWKRVLLGLHTIERE